METTHGAVRVRVVGMALKRVGALPPLGWPRLGPGPGPRREVRSDVRLDRRESLAWFYSLTSDYALAIALLTLLIMLVFTPLTLKGTKSMMAMQELQPEIKRLQNEHRNDRQKLNEEMMRLYQANGVNPLGGCLPSLVQLPVFFVLYRVINGLTRRVGGEGENAELFNPQYISSDSDLYRDLSTSDEMSSLGVDLARSANDVLQSDFVEALPYLGLVGVTFLLAWFQQRQMRSRRSDATAPNPQMELMMKILPFMLPVFAFLVQAALAVYFITSSLYRIGQQAFIHRTMPMPTAAGPAPADDGGDNGSSASSRPTRTNTRRDRSRGSSGSGNGERSNDEGSSDSEPSGRRGRQRDGAAAEARRERSKAREAQLQQRQQNRSNSRKSAPQEQKPRIESRRTSQNRPAKKKKR